MDANSAQHCHSLSRSRSTYTYICCSLQVITLLRKTEWIFHFAATLASRLKLFTIRIVLFRSSNFLKSEGKTPNIVIVCPISIKSSKGKGLMRHRFFPKRSRILLLCVIWYRIDGPLMHWCPYAILAALSFAKNSSKTDKRALKLMKMWLTRTMLLLMP